jgi:hypothetical protein
MDGDLKLYRYMALIDFGPCENVDAADAELRRAGYEVFRLPNKYRARLADPLEDFMEAHKSFSEPYDTVISTIFREVKAAVDEYGGYCRECGLIEPDHVPFAEFFSNDRTPFN